jgi:hypothetical protein
VEQSGTKWGEWIVCRRHGGDRASSPHRLPQLLSLPCLLNSQLTVAKAALSRLSTQSMPLIWPLSNRTQKMYSSSCLTSLVSGTLRRETIIALLKCYPGYSRIILAGLALHYMSYHPKYCTLLYCISCLLDAVDGQAARALDQTSKFGAVLDMVTDRYGTRQWHVPCIDWWSKVHHLLPPMLPFVSVPSLRAVLPIFDFLGLCESLYAHVQASKT